MLIKLLEIIRNKAADQAAIQCKAADSAPFPASGRHKQALIGVGACAYTTCAISSYNRENSIVYAEQFLIFILYMGDH